MRLPVGRSSISVALTLLGPLAAHGQLQILPPGAPAGADTVSLAWDPSPSLKIAGYQVRWGFAAGECTNWLDAGGVTNTTVSGLQTNAWYFFTVVVTNEIGDESVPSNEVAWSLTLRNFPMPSPECAPRLYQFGNVASFAGANGANPYAPLIAGTEGNLYGTTSAGGTDAVGTNGAGTVFQLSSSGIIRTISYLSDWTGINPLAPLALGTDGYLYGTTSSGSLGAGGSAFQVSTDGQLAFVSLSSHHGSSPAAGLMQSASADFYGTTTADGPGGAGTVFRANSAGVLTTVLSFNGTNGARPRGPLLELADGTVYGTTSAGGANNLGTIFRISPAGIHTILFHFSGARDGASPRCGLVLGRDGQLYGTTSAGGAANSGTVFRITPSGSLSTLYAFSGGIDGASPCAGLIQASDGSLLGTTVFGGLRTNGFASGCGTVFCIDTNGAFSTVYRFSGVDGANPYAGLLEAPNGVFYGTTANGGSAQLGSVFRLKSLAQPVARALGRTGNRLIISWLVTPSARYQLQYAARPDSVSWSDLGSPLSTTNSVLATSDTLGPDPQRHYRLLMLQD